MELFWNQCEKQQWKKALWWREYARRATHRHLICSGFHQPWQSSDWLLSPVLSPCCSAPTTHTRPGLVCTLLLWEMRSLSNGVLVEAPLLWRKLCIQPFDSTKYAEALSKAIRQPHVPPDVSYIWAIVHTAGGAGNILKNGHNTYGPLLVALASRVLLIQPHHPYAVSRKANLCLLSSCELHVLP